MTEYFTKTRNLIFLIISLIICAFLAIVLGMQIMFPIIIVAIIVLGGFKDKGKLDWPGVIATLLGGIIIQLFLLL